LKGYLFPVRKNAELKNQQGDSSMQKWIALMAGLVLLPTTAVAGLFGPSAEDALQAFMEAERQQDWAAAYGYVSAPDKAAKPLDAYLAEKTVADPFAALMLESMGYEIQSVTEEGDTAEATVSVTEPDIPALGLDIIWMGLAAAFQPELTEEAITRELAGRYQDGGIPTVTTDQIFRLVKEEGAWKVRLGWDEARAAAISALEEKRAYLDQIELYDLAAETVDAFNGTRARVGFKLRNHGDRTLSKVEVTVYFKDKDGTTIAEERFHPVWVTRASARHDVPLKPNYIWQQERGKAFTAKSVPDEWQVGAIEAVITDIEFAEAPTEELRGKPVQAQPRPQASPVATEKPEPEKPLTAEDRYKAAIKAKIQRHWRRPDIDARGLSAEIRVRLFPGGGVSSVEVVRSSGNEAFDRSAETAVWRADPLPVPRGQDFHTVSDLALIFDPKEIR
jgi:TonB family protein